MDRLLLVEANHRSSSASLRERLFFEPADTAAVLERLREGGLQAAMALATCDRVQILAANDDPDRAVEIILDGLSSRSGVPRAELDAQCIRFDGHAALRHMFLVAASLESLIVGEPQVLGQVRAGDRLAREVSMIDSTLDAALSGAYRAAKRVRTETAVGERPVSIAASAERVARNVHGDLAEASALLVGGGEMGCLIADHLRAAGLRRLTVTARIAAQAQGLARQLGGHYGLYDELEDLLVDADIVIAALGAGRPMIAAPMVQRAIVRRRRKPVFVIDASVPGDVDTRANDLDGAFLYDLDDLEAVASEGRVVRDGEAAAARTIVDEEVSRFILDQAGRDADPLVTGLRRHFEAVREQVLAEAGDNSARATQLLINRLLHEPSLALRQMAEKGGASIEEAQTLLAQLFDVTAADEESDA
jgi:glutamyl-tRNA reductase